jgi:hypothetical protein
VLGQATLDSQDSPRLGLRGSHHLRPYSILYASLWHPHPNGFLSRDSQGGVPKLFEFGLPGLCNVITLFLDLQLRWGLKQTCSSPREISNSVLHSTYTHQGRVDSQLLMVENQTTSLIPNPSFCHNLCCRCPNGPCKAIFGIYTLISFQWYKGTP